MAAPTSPRTTPIDIAIRARFGDVTDRQLQQLCRVAPETMRKARATGRIRRDAVLRLAVLLRLDVATVERVLRAGVRK